MANELFVFCKLPSENIIPVVFFSAPEAAAIEILPETFSLAELVPEVPIPTFAVVSFR